VKEGEATSSAQKPIIRAERLSKVFGRRGGQALELRRSGKGKAEVEKETGSTIGVFDANFEVYRGEIFAFGVELTECSKEEGEECRGRDADIGRGADQSSITRQ
jgi:hypothetical protein